MDIGKTLETLGKEESIKGVLTAMVTAGVLDKLNTAAGWQNVNASSTFGAQFQKTLTGLLPLRYPIITGVAHVSYENLLQASRMSKSKYDAILNN